MASKLIPSLEPDTENCKLHNTYDVQSCVLAGISILLGTVICFYGYRLFKLVLFLTGFLVVFFLTYVLCHEYLTEKLSGEALVYKDQIFLGISAGTGLIAGVLTVCFFYVGLFVLGATMGWFVGMAFLPILYKHSEYLSEHNWLPYIILSAFAIAGGILILCIQRVIIIISTSFLGAFWCISGIDYYVENSKVLYYSVSILHGHYNKSALPHCWYTWLVLCLTPFMSIAGIAVQFCKTAKDRDHREAYGSRSSTAQYSATPMQDFSDQVKTLFCCTQSRPNVKSGIHSMEEMQTVVVDVGSEWRTFSNEKATSDPSRVGAAQNPLLGGGDLSTIIERVPVGNSETDGYSKYHNRGGLTGSDRSLMNAFREIGIMADRINLPRKIVDRANQLFKQVHEQKSLKGRSNDAIASACLYIACRQEGVPRTFKEICAISKISKKEIGRCFKLILKALETSVDLITTADFMSRFCSNLGLPPHVQKAATHIARRAVDLDLVPGRSPISVAAAAIYMASQASEEKKSQKEIGDIAGVADVTIRQSYRLIFLRAAELFPSDFKFTTPVDKLPNL